MMIILLLLTLLAIPALSQTPKLDHAPGPNDSKAQDLTVKPVPIKPFTEKTLTLSSELPFSYLLTYPLKYREELPTFAQFHADQVASFIRSKGFGIARVVPLPRNHNLFTSGLTTYRVKATTLISLFLHDPPAAYVGNSWGIIKMAHMDSELSPLSGKVSSIKTRPLTDPEEKALQDLKAGQDTVATESVMVGAIRASASCLKCHEVDKDDLLGAFTYTVEKLPVSFDSAQPVAPVR